MVLHQHANLLVLRHDHRRVVPTVSVRAAKLRHRAALVRFECCLERLTRVRWHHAGQRAHCTSHGCNLQLCKPLLFYLMRYRWPEWVGRGSQLSCVVLSVMQILSAWGQLVNLLRLGFDVRRQSNFWRGHSCLVFPHLLLFLQQRRWYALLDLIETVLVWAHLSQRRWLELPW